jgi:lysophospholipase L1-like esterase
MPLLTNGQSRFLGGGNSVSVPQSIALLGDSITLANDAEWRNVAYFGWANALAGTPFQVSVFSGVGGNTTGQMLARVANDIVAQSPSWCCVMGGTNDISGGVVTLPTMQSNLSGICDALHAAGIRIILCTITPSTSYNTADEKQLWHDINGWIRTYAAAHSSYITLADVGELYADPGNDGQPLAGYTHDGVHPNALGAYTIGVGMAAALSGVVPTCWTFGRRPADTRLLTPNPWMTGTTGTKGANCTGVVATGWTAYRAVASKVARTDGIAGEWQKIEVTAGQTSAWIDSGDILSGFSVGDTIVAQAEVETDDDWTSPTQFYLKCEARNAGGLLLYRGSLINIATTGASVPRATRLILRGQPFVVPATTTFLRHQMAITASPGSSFRVGRYEIRKLASA